MHFRSFAACGYLHTQQAAASVDDNGLRRDREWCEKGPSFPNFLPHYRVVLPLASASDELIVFDLKPPLKRSAVVYLSLIAIGNIATSGSGEAGGAAIAAAAERRVVATTVRCPLCAGYGGRYQRGRAFRMHLLSPVHQLSDSPVRACVRVHGATAVDVVLLLISACAPVVCVRVWWVQEDVDAVSTAVRLAEAAADAEAVALLAKSGGAAAVQGSQAGQTGEQGDAAVMAKESEPGMVSARMETRFSFVLQGLSGIGIETHAVGMRHLSAK